MYEQLALYIDGEFLAGEGRRTQDVINPATLEVLGQLPHATEADLDRALAAAQRAFESWKHRSEEHTSELQSLMRISYAVFCLKQKRQQQECLHSVTGHTPVHLTSPNPPHNTTTKQQLTEL